jgi:hypothetical protein
MVVKFERLNANFNEAENVVRFASQSHILERGEGDKGGGGQFDGDAGERGQMQQQVWKLCIKIKMGKIGHLSTTV